MFFTLEDFKKIEEYLRLNAKKDTDFQKVTDAINEEDTIAFVHVGRNYRMSIKELASIIFSTGNMEEMAKQLTEIKLLIQSNYTKLDTKIDTWGNYLESLIKGDSTAEPTPKPTIDPTVEPTEETGSYYFSPDAPMKYVDLTASIEVQGSIRSYYRSGVDMVPMEFSVVSSPDFIIVRIEDTEDVLEKKVYYSVSGSTPSGVYSVKFKQDGSEMETTVLINVSNSGGNTPEPTEEPTAEPGSNVFNVDIQSLRLHPAEASTVEVVSVINGNRAPYTISAPEGWNVVSTGETSMGGLISVGVPSDATEGTYTVVLTQWSTSNQVSVSVQVYYNETEEPAPSTPEPSSEPAPQPTQEPTPDTPTPTDDTGGEDVPDTPGPAPALYYRAGLSGEEKLLSEAPEDSIGYNLAIPDVQTPLYIRLDPNNSEGISALHLAVPEGSPFKAISLQQVDTYVWSISTETLSTNIAYILLGLEGSGAGLYRTQIVVAMTLSTGEPNSGEPDGSGSVVLPDTPSPTELPDVPETDEPTPEPTEEPSYTLTYWFDGNEDEAQPLTTDELYSGAAIYIEAPTDKAELYLGFNPDNAEGFTVITGLTVDEPTTTQAFEEGDNVWRIPIAMETIEGTEDERMHVHLIFDYSVDVDLYVYPIEDNTDNE